MQFSTAVLPHLKPITSVSKVMLKLLLALLPGIITMTWFFGSGVLINLGLAVLTAIVAEALMLWLRGRPIIIYLLDLSAVVTAVLLALALPVIALWWVTVIGTSFAIIIAKHLYGGLGYNPFNPAMVGYVLLLISFPQQMTVWLPPATITDDLLSVSDTLRMIFLEQLPGNISFDAITRQTPLDHIKTQLDLGLSISEISANPVFSLLAGKSWGWVSLSYLLGGLWLIQQRVVAWQIPLSLLSALTLFSSICYGIDDQQFISPLFHLLSGATMLGAFFIASDPVTASTTNRGRLIYGAMIGLLIYVIRVWGGYPDAVAFAVLLMNLSAPTIDYYTRPKALGERLRSDE